MSLHNATIMHICHTTTYYCELFCVVELIKMMKNYPDVIHQFWTTYPVLDDSNICILNFVMDAELKNHIWIVFNHFD